MTSPNLMQAILAMDAYNQGYNKGINHGQMQIGLATFTTDSAILDTPGNEDVAQNTGFYAVAYNYDGETVISYRGTDQGSDVWTGWLAGLGVWTSPQVKLAADFYNALFPDTSAHGVTFTGHSLGGGLAGIMGSIR